MPRDADGARTVAEEIAPTLRILDGLVSTDAAAVGSFTIADCAVAPVSVPHHPPGLDLIRTRTSAPSATRVIARPAFAAAGPVI